MANLSPSILVYINQNALICTADIIYSVPLPRVLIWQELYSLVLQIVSCAFLHYFASFEYRPQVYNIFGKLIHMQNK